MKSLNIQTNQNQKTNYNYQCEFNYIGCKISFPSKGEVKQHYKDSLNKHLLLLQEKIIKIDSVNYSIKKDYHRLFKIISNIQQFKKFPDICPKPEGIEDKEEEISKNKSKKKEIEKDKIVKSQNLQNLLLLNQIIKKQKLEEMIGNKRNRRDELKDNNNKNEKFESNEEIALLTVEDDNNDNSFVHDDERKHKIFLNNSEDNNNENNVETKKNMEIRNNSYSSHRNNKEITPIILNSIENENIINKSINNFNIKNYIKEKNDEQVKSFLSDKEKSSQYNIDLLDKDYIKFTEKFPENEHEINQSQISQRDKNLIILNEVKENKGNTNDNYLEKNIKKDDKKNPPYIDMIKYEILSDSDNDGEFDERGKNKNTQDFFKNIISNNKINNLNYNNNTIQNQNLNQTYNNKLVDYSKIINRVDYSDQILNDKKVQWEVELKKITGWFAIGISEIFDYDANSNKGKLEYNNNKYFLSNENIINNINDNKRVKMNSDLKEGNNLICLYSPKFNQLKIKNGNDEYLIDNVIERPGKALVPTAFFENKSDQVIFHNYKILADYKK